MHTEFFLPGLIPFEPNPAAVGAPFTHDTGLVGIAMIVSVAAAFAFFELAGRGRLKQAVPRFIWMSAAGAMLGYAVWATHFVGMLAFQSPLQHSFLMMPTAISALTGIVCAALGFTLASRDPTPRNLVLGGAAVGLSAIVMHYLGMRGLNIEAALSYQPLPVIATSIGAVAASIAAFFMAHSMHSSWTRAAAAFPAGAITAGLHFTDMAATIMAPRPAFAAPQANFDAVLAAATIGVTALFVAAGLIVAALDYRGLFPAGRRKGAPPFSGEEHVIVIPTPKSSQEESVIILPSRRREG